VAARAREGSWIKALDESKQANEAAIAPLIASDDVPLNHHRLMGEIRDFIRRETIITVDGQISFTTARQVLPSYAPASRLNAGSNGCMGVAVPFAVGAALARPGTPVLSVNGDAAFGFNGLEIETALRYDLPIVFVVDNNNGIMGNVLERQMFPNGHDEPVATYGRSHRYDLIAEAFGGHAEHVERPEEIRPALERAFGSGRASIINVAVDPEAIWPLPRPGRSASSLMGY
jgi:thiamine pyrophosphate-dependent acetolactate synthase large subunit-like protein